MANNEIYTPKEGDCLSSLAVTKHFDADAAWNGLPPAVQKNLTSPNHLIPGRPIPLPTGELTSGGKTSGKQHGFVTPTAKVKLRVLLADMRDKPLEGEYKFGHRETAWRYTDKIAIPADGIIEKEVPATTSVAELTVYPKAAAKPAASPPPPAATADAYPPPIRAADFPDKPAPPSADAEPKPLPIVWTLQVGAVPSHTAESGMLARLGNLGFEESKGLDALIPLFRTWYGTEKDAKLASLAYFKLSLSQKTQAQNDLRDIHDSVTPKSRPAILDAE